MRTFQERQARLAGQTASDMKSDTLAKEIPALDHVFKILAQGYTPNFLDILSAISEMSLSITECDPKADPRFAELCKMSQNKCRFCS